MGNDRLRHHMRVSGTSATDLATAIAVDPKTVLRWIDTGRVPQSRHRSAVAELLQVEETFLWPEVLDDARTATNSRAEVRAIYPTRGNVPPDVWRRLIESATHQVDVLVYAGLFLVDTHPELPRVLAERASEGLQGRLAYGDPDSAIVAARGEEEGINENLSARIRLTLTYMRPVVGVPGIEVRKHQSILYDSIYRFDDEMLVNTHVYGSPASQNPVLHLERVPGGHMFDHYATAFDRIWEAATPLDG